MDPPDSKRFPSISIVSKRPPILSEASNTSIVASDPKSSRRKCDELEPPMPAPMTAILGLNLRSAAKTDLCLAKKRVGNKKMLVPRPKPNARYIAFSVRAVMTEKYYADCLSLRDEPKENLCLHT